MQLKTSLLLFSLLGIALARRNGSASRIGRPRRSPLFLRATGEVAQPPAAVSSVNDNDGPGSQSPGYVSYSGSGTGGWPAYSEWISFESMWSNLQNNLGQSCVSGVTPNSESETADVRTAIENIAASSQVDHRFILAVIMNESSGCVRVPTTMAPSGTIYNPGLMQDFDGYYTCNCVNHDEYGQNCGLVNPCPQSTISGMISEGSMGTNAGSGLADLINHAQASGATGAQTFYVAANLYNGGINSVKVGDDLSQYAQKIANWVVGWEG